MGRGIAIGALIATGALMLVPGVAAATARAAKPIVRAVIRGGAANAHIVQQSLAETYEHFEDIVAEARAEIQVAGSDASAAGPAAPASAEADDAGAPRMSAAPRQI